MFKGYLLPINFRTKIPFWFQKTTYKLVILIIIMSAPMEENFIYRTLIIINKSKTCNHFWIKTNNNKNPSKLKDFIFGFTFKF